MPGSECGHGGLYASSVCLGCVTGPGTAPDGGRNDAHRFHTCLPHRISGCDYVAGGAPRFSSSRQVGNNLQALMFVNICLSFWDGLTPETTAQWPCVRGGKASLPASAMLAFLYRQSA